MKLRVSEALNYLSPSRRCRSVACVKASGGTPAWGKEISERAIMAQDKVVDSERTWIAPSSSVL